jgi:SAM-dependent methyltransferase
MTMPTDPGDAEGAVFLRSMGEHLPLADSSFDAAILCETLDHCLDPGAVIGEARRVLKPEGILGIMQNVQAPGHRTGVPLRRRVRVGLGRLRSRLGGRRRLDAGKTKTCPLRAEDLIALVSSEMTIVSSDACDQVIFMRALKTQRASARAAGGETSR